ncbi:MAG: HDOD domain-containing protein [Mariprofundales bacterium]|nr:HDOD domain-containing protein [Mariprofundales bacterium]
MSLSDNIFIGRQPIFNRDNAVEAYELLYRPAKKALDASGMIDGEQATAKVLVNTLMEFGLERVAGNKLLFVNSTHAFLTGDEPELLPPDQVVLEVQGGIAVDSKVLTSLLHWKTLGFTIALDNFVYAPHLQSLVDLADIIKINISVLPNGMAQVRESLRDFSGRLLVEKVETQQEHDEALVLGFDLFQGYFYNKPEVLGKKGINANKAQAMQVVQQAMTAVSPGELEEVISHDMAITYKLLTYINSPAFGLRMEIKSIKHALTLLGLRSVRTWVSMVALSTAASDKPDELIKQSMVRGRFLEQLTEAEGKPDLKSDAFVLGMFSLLEAMLDQPMAAAIADLSLPDLVRQGLLNGDSPFGKKVRLIELIERADWDAVASVAAELPQVRMPALYIQAIFWADAINFG